MMKLPSFSEIRAQAWKIGTISLGVVSLGLGVALFISNRHADKLQTSLDRCADNLTTARNNVTILEADIAAQNFAIENLKSESKRRTDAAAKALAEAQKRTRVVERRVAVLADRPIEGATLEARVLSVDAMVLETVK
jgi:hypothetical protein